MSDLLPENPPAPENGYHVDSLMDMTPGLFNSIFSSIHSRIAAREELEADFEDLIAQGTSAALTMIQENIAPQITDLQDRVSEAEDAVEDLIEAGTAPNAAKLGNELPAFYLDPENFNVSADVKDLLQAENNSSVLAGITGSSDSRLGTFGLEYRDINDIPVQSGFYHPTGASAVGYFGPYSPLLRQMRSPTRGWDINSSINSIAFRIMQDNWGDWNEFWHHGNAPLVSLTEARAGSVNKPRLYSPELVSHAIAAKIEDTWAMQPIGVPVPLLDNLVGVAAPPTNKDYRYIKLTASDAYNTGVLTGQSVSGTAPLVVATAVINLAGSPLNGRAVNLINTERRFLRAGNAGSVENDQMQKIVGAFGDLWTNSGNRVGTGAVRASGSPAANNTPSSGGGNNTRFDFDSDNSPGARTGDETRPKNVGVTYYMRIL